LTVLASAGILRFVPGPTDDGSPRARGAVRPPPAPEAGDLPPTIDVPRLEPPPPSLEAMVQSARRDRDAETRSSWPLLVALVVLAGLVTAYVSR